MNSETANSVGALFAVNCSLSAKYVWKIYETFSFCNLTGNSKFAPGSVSVQYGIKREHRCDTGTVPAAVILDVTQVTAQAIQKATVHAREGGLGQESQKTCLFN